MPPGRDLTSVSFGSDSASDLKRSEARGNGLEIEYLEFFKLSVSSEIFEFISLSIIVAFKGDMLQLSDHLYRYPRSLSFPLSLQRILLLEYWIACRQSASLIRLHPTPVIFAQAYRESLLIKAAMNHFVIEPHDVS